MTQRLQSRERELPEGYQFGDAGWKIGDILSGPFVEWAAIENALDAECDLPLAVPGWNVIEGDHFTTDRDTGDEA